MYIFDLYIFLWLLHQCPRAWSKANAGQGVHRISRPGIMGDLWVKCWSLHSPETRDIKEVVAQWKKPWEKLFVSLLPVKLAKLVCVQPQPGGDAIYSFKQSFLSVEMWRKGTLMIMVNPALLFCSWFTRSKLFFLTTWAVKLSCEVTELHF